VNEVGHADAAVLESDELDLVIAEFASALTATLPGAAMPAESLPGATRQWLFARVTGGSGGSDQIALALAQAPLAQACAALVRLRRDLVRLLLNSPAGTRVGATVLAIEAAIDDELIRLALSSHARATCEPAPDLLPLLLAVGHELRNPLSAIETSAYLAAQRVTSGETALARQLQKIRKQVQLASHVVEKLLDLARQRPAKRGDWALRSLVESALETQQLAADVCARIEISEELTVCVDAELVRIILVNLLSNANDALTEAGGGTVTVNATVSGDALDLCVCDDGPGIPPEIRTRLFDVAFTTKQHGHGLGLAICRRLAERHGATLTLDDTQRGAAFRLHIPSALPGTESPKS
jgi:signal transduction histidine kinase